MLAVIGVGAIGGVCAAELAAAGQPVMGCVRRPFEVLVLEAPDRTLRVTLPLATDPRAAPPLDVEWCLLATKATQNEEAMRWFEALDTGDTRLAVVQNGVEHVARVSRWVGAERVVPVVVGCPATAIEPGHIVQRGPARMWVPHDENGRAFAALFEGSAIEVERTKDWKSAAWRKLCSNVVGGAIAALAGRPMPAVQHPHKRELALALALECAVVARAEGADLDDAFATRVALGQADATTQWHGGPHRSPPWARHAGQRTCRGADGPGPRDARARLAAGAGERARIAEAAS
jgi:2-dehydropantoate 2-reductase